MTIHYFEILCDSDIEEGDGFAIYEKDVTCPKCLADIQASRPTMLEVGRGCRHSLTNVSADPETGEVYCFSCNPPRRLS